MSRYTTIEKVSVVDERPFITLTLLHERSSTRFAVICTAMRRWERETLEELYTRRD